MVILGIDTVTKVGSLALYENDCLIGQYTIDANLDHAANIIVALNDLLYSTGKAVPDIGCVAVDVGPGSFTGLRVGLSSAKGLVQESDVTLFGVCSLDVLCCKALMSGVVLKNIKYVLPFIDAKRNSIYTAIYEIHYDENKQYDFEFKIRLKSSDDSRPVNCYVKTVRKPYVTTLENIVKENENKDCHICGPDIVMLNEKRKALFPSAEYVAELASRGIVIAGKDKKVEPLYVYDVEYRKSEI